VGSLFVQLVRKLFPEGDRVHVIALASASHRHTLEQIGASEVMDYETRGWEHQIKNVDMFFDTVGGEVLTKAWNMVTEKGTIVTVADPPPAWVFNPSPPSELANHPNVRYE
jgi:NADPH:quinone reductase-like Zn-dependent oxidoreductase